MCDRYITLLKRGNALRFQLVSALYNIYLTVWQVTRESELVVKNTGRPVAINAGYLKSYPNKSVYERPTKVRRWSVCIAEEQAINL